MPALECCAGADQSWRWRSYCAWRLWDGERQRDRHCTQRQVRLDRSRRGQLANILITHNARKHTRTHARAGERGDTTERTHNTETTAGGAAAVFEISARTHREITPLDPSCRQLQVDASRQSEQKLEAIVQCLACFDLEWDRRESWLEQTGCTHAPGFWRGEVGEFLEWRAALARSAPNRRGLDARLRWR